MTKKVETFDEAFQFTMVTLIHSEPFYANLILNCVKHVTTDIPTLGVNVTDNVNLYVNPYFFMSMTVKERVSVLKHECVFGDCLIDTDQGKLKIKDIVNNKMPVKVLSLSSQGQWEYQPITAYSKKSIQDFPNKHWVSIKYTKNNRLYSSAIITNDHQIAVMSNPLSTEIQYIKAENSKGLYSVRYPNEHRKLNKERFAYSPRQIEAAIGCLLGDSSISKQGTLATSGGKIHRGYMEYKQSLLGGFMEEAWSGYKQEYSNLHINHGVREQTKYLRTLLYKHGKKSPISILNMITPISLAFWYMDDGSKGKGNNQVTLHTEGFSYRQNQALSKKLKEKYDILAHIKPRSHRPDLFCLKLKTVEAHKLFKLIAPFVHSSMKYKLPEEYHSMVESQLLIPDFLNYSIKKITEVKKLTPKLYSALYDITVANNHNFLANNTLVHNCLHILNNHIARFKELEPQIYEKKEKTNIFEQIERQQTATGLNYAGDFAINEFLPELPKKMQFFDKAGNAVVEPQTIADAQGNPTPNPKAGQPITGQPCLVESLIKQYPKANIQHNMNLEYYYEIIKQQQEKDKKNGKGKTVYVLVDDHSMWGEGAENPEYIEEKVKQVVNRAIEASGGREAGNLPSNIQAMIDALFYKPLNWKGKLRQFSARATEVIIEETRSRRNRRFGILYSGYKSFPKLRMGACVDTSGSMSDESLCQVLAELIEISKNNVEIVLVEADCSVHNVSEFDAKKVKAFSGRGGTAYQPAIDKCLEMNVDCIAYFGDFDTSDTPVLKRKLPFLWVGVNTTQKAPGNFGSTIYAKINKKK